MAPCVDAITIILTRPSLHHRVGEVPFESARRACRRSSAGRVIIQQDGFSDLAESRFVPLSLYEHGKWIGETFDCVVVAAAFDEAMIGVATCAGRPELAVYDTDKCIQVLMRDSQMDEEEATEYFELNVIGAGREGGPLYLQGPPKDVSLTSPALVSASVPINLNQRGALVSFAYNCGHYEVTGAAGSI